MIRGLRLLSRQVLGINRRNYDLLARYNPRAFFQVVDHKLKTKHALTSIGVPVVDTMAEYRLQNDIKRFASDSRSWREFVIKPAQGSGGGGVIVVTDRRGKQFETLGGRYLSLRQLESHLSDILGGVYSLNQRYDEAMVERRIHAHPVLAALSSQGLPDLRIVVFRGVPLLAMLRLATKASRGRANLHVGGIGVGVDLVSGRATAAIAGKRQIFTHPDTDQPLLGVQIPCWEDTLGIAARCADAVALGYLGVDMTLDVEHGPLVLELNARPGLAIQLANRRGLRPLLTAAEQCIRPGLSVAERVQLGRQLSQS
ncbi:MAG: alpha-L-glutamate ligase-like protein [Candidatus Binatia bacterium]